MQTQLERDFVASQPGPCSNSKAVSDIRRREEAAVGDGYDNLHESSEFSKQWKAVKFTRDEVDELLKEEPACDRCVRLGIPCNAVKAKLICKECQTCKIICPRTFNNIVRVLAEKLGESEEDMRSKHIQFMAPSRQKEMVRKVGGVVNGEAAKDKAKKGEASVHGGLERRRRREKQKPPMIFIPGGRANKPKEIEIRGIDEEEISPKTTCATLTFSETQFECSNSRTPLGEMPNEDALEMNADAPWISKPQSKRSDPRLPRSNNEAENSTQIGGNGPGLSTPQPNSQLPLPNDTRAVDNDSESSSQMRIDVPRMSIPQPRCSESQDLYASNGQTAMGEEDTPASEITLGVPELSKSQPQPSHSHLNLNQVPDNDEDFLQMHVDTPTPPNPGHSRFNVQTSSISLELKRKMWDDLSRAGLYEHLETYETEKTLTRQHLHEIWDARDALGAQLLGVTEELEIYRTKVKHLEDTDLPSEITTEWDHLKELLANAGSEVQQARNQRLEAESELPVLRKKVETLTEERDRALNKSQQFKDLHLKAQAAQLEIRQVRSQGLEPESELSQSQKKVETQAEERDNEAQRLRDSLVPKPFGWGAPVNGWTAWDQVCDEEISVRGRLSSLGAQSNVQVENPGHIAALGEVLAIRCRMLEEEKNRRMELEKEVSNLRSDRGKVILFSHMLSEYAAFSREVQMTVFALNGVEASISRETSFPYQALHGIIQILAEASDSAKKRIRTIEEGRIKIESHSLASSQEKRGTKRKERECWNGNYNQ